MAESTPQPGRNNESTGPEFARAFASNVRRPHERSLTGRLGLAAALAVTVGAVVVGVGAVAHRAPGDSGRRVSAESSYRSPTPTASPTATPSPRKSRVTHRPTATHRPSHKVGTAQHKKRKVRRRPAFGGVSNVLLRNTATHLCADLPNYDKGSVNGPVNQFTCSMGSADNQVWSLGVIAGVKGPHGASVFEIRNVKDDLCMDLPDRGAQPAGAKIAEGPCDPTTGDNQLWFLRAAKGGHLIRSRSSHGLCLGVTDRAAAGANARLEIQPCGHGDVWSWPRG